MKTLPPLRFLCASVLSAGLWLCGCHGNQQAAASSAEQSDQPSNNPDTANLAPVADTGSASTPVYPNSSVYPPPSYPPGEYQGEYSNQGEDTADESYYGVEPADTAPEPPPPLPEYDQPPCPGDGYIWTPGYWDYASTGYYWVPGVWVQAPYEGALWTPGYWGYSHGHYAFFNGYWGTYIGFYGGINYGFGYTGVGYQGGYWNNGRFNYNRSVNNVNVSVVHNLYNRTIAVNRTTINRVSYNGGSGGIQARPRPAELAALREPHAAPMQSQLQVQRSASENRSQFAAVNHGRPSQVTDTRPVAAVANVKPEAPSNIHNLPTAARPPLVARNNAAPANRPGETTSQPNRTQGNPAPANRPEQGVAQPNRAQPKNRPQAQAQPMRQEQVHPAPSRAEPQAQTQPMRREQVHPAPSRVEPQARQSQPNRPAPEPNRRAAPASHPAPQQSRPASPQNHAAPARPAAPEHKPPAKEQPKDEHRPQ